MARILEAMAEKLPGEYEAQDPLEQLLDEESDDEFGLPEFREHLADSLTPAVLKDWSAADFASIYVRFRPHLERHARRFLVNPSQVEEVVQDAFLYLMTTLPELDSELGVLKFLKWKTRLLALDVIRANSRASFAPFDEQPEIAARDEEIGIDLERADDAAIVALALAKLQPRHREALIATLYEEKASEVVAAQMGLNENAFRQLLFRARSAFKKALVGEAETAGLRASEILSIAARKAAKESGKYISAAGAFLLVLAISVGVLPNLSQPAQEQISAPAPAAISPEDPGETAPAPANSGTGNSEVGVAAQVEGESDLESVVAESSNNEVETLDPADSVETQVSAVLVGETVSVQEPAQPLTVASSPERAVVETFFIDFLNTEAVRSLSKSTDGQVLSSSQGLLTLSNGSGITANIAYDLNTAQGIQHSWFSLEVDEMEFAAVPNVWHSRKSYLADGSAVLTLLATDLTVGDVEGHFGFLANNNSAVSSGAVSLEVVVSPAGQVIRSSLSINPRI